MPEKLQFAWGEPHEGWLYFQCPNMMAPSLESCRFILFAVDTDGRRHRLCSGLLPKAGAGAIEKNALGKNE